MAKTILIWLAEALFVTLMAGLTAYSVVVFVDHNGRYNPPECMQK